MCSFIVLMPSVRIYNVNKENEGNAMDEKVCPNFWPVLYMHQRESITKHKSVTSSRTLAAIQSGFTLVVIIEHMTH